LVFGDEVFEEIHLLLINDDHPEVEAVAPMVGDARVFIHNVPAGPPTFLRSMGWRPSLLRGWAAAVVGLGRRVGPSLVRCYGAHLNAYAALHVKQALGVPLAEPPHPTGGGRTTPGGQSPRPRARRRYQVG
jgi:hypothetical protein